MFKMILFDVDGVLLSEERYFDASALTVWEMLYSPKYLGLTGETFSPAPAETEIRRIRKDVFADDTVLDFMKSRGINGNWDMVYLSFSHQLIRLMEQSSPEYKDVVQQILAGQINRESIDRVRELLKGKPVSIDYPSFIMDFARSKAQKQDLFLYLNEIASNKLGVVTEIFSRNSVLWELCQETFQEWYLGDELVGQDIGRSSFQPGKRGFLSDEIPIVNPVEMASTLEGLQKKGIILGIGTGRPSIETLIPLEAMGLLPYFDPDRIVTASHVLEAEEQFPEHSPLAKPQPYSYIKGWLGLSTTNAECVEFPLPLANGDDLLIVGDSVADFMAAKSLGCRFAATLTGLTGQEARSKFEELKADYILNDMREVLSIAQGE